MSSDNHTNPHTDSNTGICAPASCCITECDTYADVEVNGKFLSSCITSSIDLYPEIYTMKDAQKYANGFPPLIENYKFLLSLRLACVAYCKSDGTHFNTPSSVDFNTICLSKRIREPSCNDTFTEMQCKAAHVGYNMQNL